MTATRSNRSSGRVHDPERLAALARLDLRDGRASESFNRLARLAAGFLHVPAAVVSIVEADRETFQGSHGIPEPLASMREVPADLSYCRVVVERGEPLVVDDAREDPLLSEYPALLDYGVVASLAIPLTTADGTVLGAFSVMDSEPRHWSSAEISLLTDLTASVMTEIELQQQLMERARAEADRQAAEERSASILESITDGFFALDADDCFTYINEAAERLMRAERADLLGRSIWEAFPGARGTPFEDAYHQAVAGRTASVEAYFEPLGVWVVSRIYPSENGLSVYCQDITDRHRAEEKLAVAEHHYRRLIETSPYGIFAVDREGRFVEVNPALARIFGRPAQALVGMHYSDVLDPSEADRISEGFRAHLAQGGTGVRTYECSLRVPSGEKRVGEIRACTLFHDGEPIGSQGVVREITEARRLEQEKERLVAVLEETPDYVEVRDLSGRVLFLNRMGRWLTQADPEVDGGPPLDRVYPAWALEIVEQEGIPTAIRMGRWSGETAVLDKHGCEIPVSQVIVAHRDGLGKVQHLSTLMRDISDVKAQELELRSANERLETFLNTLPDQAWLKDLAGRYILVNEATARASGVKPLDMIGRTDEELYPPSVARSFRENDQAVIESGESRTFEETDEDLGRAATFYDVVKAPVRDAAGTITGTLGISHDVTHRRMTEAALRESEERFRIIFDNAAVGIALSGLDGRCLRANQHLADLLGRAPEDLVGRTFSDLTHPDDRPKDARLVEWLHTGCPSPVFSTEKRFLTRAGEIVWVHVSISPVRTAAGEISYLVGIVEDITTRKKAEEALRSSEERLRRILGTMADAITIVDTEGRFTFANVGAERVLGLTGGAMGRPFDSEEWQITAVDGGPFPRERLPFVRVMETGEPVFGIEHAIRHPDGSRHILSINAAPLRNVNGDLEEVIFSIRDATEAREAAEKIRFQARLIEAVGQAVIATDAEGRLVSWNSSAEELYGWSAEEALGHNVIDVTAAHDAQEQAASVFEHVRSGNVWSGEFALRTRDGSIFPGHVTVSPVVEEDGEITGVIGISHDLTERKHLEEQLRQAQKMEAIGRLAGGVAHDFNNLLMVIDANTRFVLEDLPPDSPARGDLLQVTNAAERGASVIKQLLAFSRKQVLQPQVLDLNEVVDNTKKMLGRLMGEDVELISDLAARRGRVEADQAQLVQVLINLAVNARDAMPTGGRLRVGTANATISTEEADRYPYQVEPGPYVALTVEDSGHGMDEAVLARIFEPFFTTKERGKGTGLGLATVYGIVKQSGGYIWVESEPGAGTTFRIYLPQVNAGVEESEAGASHGRTGSGQTILVVEDEDSVRTLARRVLERAGFRVLEASNGEDALQVAHQFSGRIDLLLSDVVMPRMSGRILAEKLALDRPDTPVIFMSGYTDDAVLHHGVSQAEVHLLHKPISPEELIQAVAEALNS